jgi:hypothetical protein
MLREQRAAVDVIGGMYAAPPDGIIDQASVWSVVGMALHIVVLQDNS